MKESIFYTEIKELSEIELPYVYYKYYKPSEWVENQRQLMVDSALYLDSQEFKETFPQINKLIRTRKTDIQKILLHMTKYISEDMQLDGNMSYVHLVLIWQIRFFLSISLRIKKGHQKNPIT